ncbi:hypothetical protein BC628DRAFT_570934 [Trametes gibbosa]|nr:hypothetical protein BC628DRAFT_570934 [Trametes gibbosa]
MALPSPRNPARPGRCRTQARPCERVLDASKRPTPKRLLPRRSRASCISIYRTRWQLGRLGGEAWRVLVAVVVVVVISPATRLTLTTSQRARRRTVSVSGPSGTTIAAQSKPAALQGGTDRQRGRDRSCRPDGAACSVSNRERSYAKQHCSTRAAFVVGAFAIGRRELRQRSCVRAHADGPPPARRPDSRSLVSDSGGEEPQFGGPGGDAPAPGPPHPVGEPDSECEIWARNAEKSRRVVRIRIEEYRGRRRRALMHLRRRRQCGRRRLYHDADGRGFLGLDSRQPFEARRGEGRVAISGFSANKPWGGVLRRTGTVDRGLSERKW